MATVESSNKPKRESQQGGPPEEHFRGWLFKWTNYLKGYQKRWFVLANGLLSYYRTQEEVAHTCRGTINLAGACIDAIDSTHFLVTNGTSQVFHLRALNEVERQRWVTALELAKARAIKNLEEASDEEETGELQEDDIAQSQLLAEKLSELSTTQNLVKQKHNELLRALTEFESRDGGNKKQADALKEKAAMFKITTSAMTKTSQEFLIIASNLEKRWQKKIKHERSMRSELQENFEALAKQMHGLERDVRRASQKGLELVENDRDLEESHQFSSTQVPAVPPVTKEEEEEVPKVPGGAQRILPILPETSKKEVSFKLPDTSESPPIPTIEPIAVYHNFSDEEDDDKFFDAPEESELPSFVTPPHNMSHHRTPSTVSVNEVLPIPPTAKPENLPTTSTGKRWETFLSPHPDLLRAHNEPTLDYRRATVNPRPNAKINLWSIMKNCIGKELTKIPVPVHFGEPLSFIQRAVEDLTYYQILDNAAACETTLEEAAHVAAFAATSYEATAIRVNKPFNPMLGETYECDRRAECGWRALVEQVSHHPPMLAMHAEHKEWTLWQEYTLASKFRGKYIQCFPVGCVHLVFHRTGSHYTWNKVITTIHNIIVGKLWVDNYGDMTVVNHTTQEKCEVKYHSYSYFTRERQRKITGYVLDKEGAPKHYLFGYWDEYFECSPIISFDNKKPITGPAKELWRVVPRPPGSEAMYNFCEFTCSLNEMEDNLPITDSRYRPDQRTMEEGDFDEANRIKALLEEKQRARRRTREALQARAAEAAANGNTEEAARLEKEASYHPQWFHKEFDPYSNNMVHVYSGGYWECKEKRAWVELDLTNIFET